MALSLTLSQLFNMSSYNPEVDLDNNTTTPAPEQEITIETDNVTFYLYIRWVLCFFPLL
ncbi:hypothetical protein DPMN_034419 [Dreissena polymorpha]|uniref:Uncharacterized protein n=1 Tax=Dreissena polymorpha TaxID=45954 RepID=A0A9D4M7M8_DREPO|nr:hypothetical protein DPMN_034419 [Dreissena polymorpha]